MQVGQLLVSTNEAAHGRRYVPHPSTPTPQERRQASSGQLRLLTEMHIQVLNRDLVAARLVTKPFTS
jgi:hypothetical protein